MAAEVDDFELFCARSYGVESELRHQRACSVRVNSKSSAPVSAAGLRGDRTGARTHRRTGGGGEGSGTSGSPSIAKNAESSPAEASAPSSPQTTVSQYRPTAAERKASFKSSSKRRAVCDDNIPEEGEQPGNERNDTSELEIANRRCSDGTEANGSDAALNARRRERQQRRAAMLAEAAGPEAVSGGDDDNSDACRVYRMRSFYTKSGNAIVNRGDSVRVHGLTPGGVPQGSKAGKNAGKKSWTGPSGANANRLTSIDDMSNSIELQNASDIMRNTGIDSAADDVPPDYTGSSRSKSTAADGNMPPGRDSATVDHGGAVTGGNYGGMRRQRLKTEPTETGGRSAGSVNLPTYRVLVMGSLGVGKTTLTQQILTSEYLANQDSFAEDESGDQIVSVQLDEEESLLHFIDVQSAELNNYKSRDCAVDAHLVVYSVTDRSSFQFAQNCLQDLRPAKRHNVVILVGNKQDLVRNRVISEEEGKHLATKKHCKFIEVSALLNHKMEELLVGTLRQIRLRQTPATNVHAAVSATKSMPANSRASSYQQQQQQQQQQQLLPTGDPTGDVMPGLTGLGCLNRAVLVVFRKVFQRAPVRSSSCDDLFKP